MTPGTLICVVPPSLFGLHCELRPGLDEQHLGQAPLESISNTVGSQELVLSNQLLDFKERPWELIFLASRTTQVR